MAFIQGGGWVNSTRSNTSRNGNRWWSWPDCVGLAQLTSHGGALRPKPANSMTACQGRAGGDGLRWPRPCRPRNRT